MEHLYCTLPSKAQRSFRRSEKTIRARNNELMQGNTVLLPQKGSYTYSWQQLWQLVQSLWTSKPDQIPSWRIEGGLKFYQKTWTYWQLIAAKSGRVSFIQREIKWKSVEVGWWWLWGSEWSSGRGNYDQNIL